MRYIKLFENFDVYDIGNPEDYYDIIESEFSDYPCVWWEDGCGYDEDECRFASREEFTKYVSEIFDIFDGLDNPVKVFRVVGADSEEDIDKTMIGEHWSFMKESALNFEGYNIDGDNVFLIEAEIEKKYIDWEQTIKLYTQFSGGFSDQDEDEIFIPYANNDAIKIISINKV